jgi:hypothetical protein
MNRQRKRRAIFAARAAARRSGLDLKQFDAETWEPQHCEIPDLLAELASLEEEAAKLTGRGTEGDI